MLSRWGIQKIARPQVIFVLGGPGSGKGTQCVKIARDFQFTHISTGDLLREEARKDGPDKAQIEAILKEGKLAPSELLVKSIKRVPRFNIGQGIPQAPAQGQILDRRFPEK